MSTKIEWVRGPDGAQGETWNPTVGCSYSSPGCGNCYAARGAKRHDRPGNAYEGTTGDDKAGWSGQVNLLPERIEQPLRWRRPRMVFVDSMSDLFHPSVPETFIGSVWDVMARTPQHTYQILTKRPQRMADVLGRWANQDWLWRRDDQMWCGWPGSGPLPNVWLGTSVESQRYADLRIPHLLETPAAVRFISAEPLLGPVDLSRWLGVEWMDTLDGYGDEMFASLHGRVGPDGGLHWVIAGGESGPGARPMHPDWARTLRDQCVAAGVPYFFKQWGEHVVEDQSPQDIALPSEAFYLLGDDGPPFYRVGKTAAGRELDGRTWDQMPEVER